MMKNQELLLKNAPTSITTYALFYNGEYLTNEQMNDKRFIKPVSR